MSPEQQALDAGIDALERQRAALGNAVVDAAIAGLRARIGALAPAAPAHDAALRQVSILFLDVVDSTRLSDRIDPEEMSAVLDRLLTRSAATVGRHGGKVVDVAGDGMLAVFGVAEVQEDDAERSVRCGLALLETARGIRAEVDAAHGYAGFDVRVGIHTGGVLVEPHGSGEPGRIRGSAVHVAARMEQAAPPGGLRISHATYAQVRGRFDAVRQAPLAIKGFDAPVASWLVLTAKPRAFRIAVPAVEGVATRMISRDAELDALKAAFRRTCRERATGVVAIVGEAGLGKSRLLAEFEVWCEDSPERVFLFRGRATPLMQRQPFALLRDIVAWHLQIHPGDTPDAAKRKIEDGVMPLFAADGSDIAEGHAHLLGHLIGLDWRESPHLRGILHDPRQIRDRGLHAAAQLFARVAAREAMPLLIEIEDLHWADDASLDFLDDLPEAAGDATAMLAVTTTRPTLFERRADRHAGDGRHRRIDLQPLDAAASRALAHELLQPLPSIPGTLEALITGGAAGNPFYMEELVRMLIDQGAIRIGDDTAPGWTLDAGRLDAAAVPVTLTGVLQARLDGLPAAERLALQHASIVGPVFSETALQALDGAAPRQLPQLLRRELVTRSLGGDYAFRHALLHQVTQATVLKTARRALHGRLADWIGARADDAGAPSGDLLATAAHHHEQAGHAAAATEFYVRAADHAAGRFAHAAALDYAAKAEALLAPDAAATHWRLLEVRERTLDLQGEREQQGRTLDAMEQLADRLGDPGRQGRAAYRRSYLLGQIGDWAALEHSARRAIDFASAAGDDETRLMSQRLIGNAMVWQDRRDEADPLLRATLVEARTLELKRAEAFCLNTLATLHERAGRHQQALAHTARELALDRELGDRRSEAIALTNLGIGRLNIGDLEGAQRYLDDSLRLVRTNGDRSKGLAARCAASTLANTLGDHPRALALADEALAIAVAVQARHWEAIAACRIGDVELARGRCAAAALAYRRARDAALAARFPVHLDAAAGLARVALADGDAAQAGRELASVLAHAETAGSFAGAEYPRLIELTCFKVLEQAGDPGARAWLARAHAALQDDAAAIDDPQLRTMFLTNRADHREIVAEWEQRARR